MYTEKRYTFQKQYDMTNLKAETNLATSSKFHPTLGMVDVNVSPSKKININELVHDQHHHQEPGVQDGVVAHSVLAVHDEDRVGWEAGEHLRSVFTTYRSP